MRRYSPKYDGLFPLNVYSTNYSCSTRKCFSPGPNGCNCEVCNASAKVVPLIVTDVTATAEYIVTVTIYYSDGSSMSVDLSKNKRYTIKYVSNGELISITGVITAIGKVNNSSNCTCDCCNGEDYLLKIDASSNYASQVVTIKSSAIREIKEYTLYGDEDTTLNSSRCKAVTIVGRVNNIQITDCTIDNMGIVSKGTIITGKPDENNCAIADGCATGVNSNGHTITVVNGRTTGGTITGGTIMTAKLNTWTAAGGNYDPETGIRTECNVEALFGTIVAYDCDVFGAKTIAGDVIEPKINPSIVAGGKRMGADMITTDAIIIDDIAYGGRCVGGIVYGGTAVGNINDQTFTIENGETSGGHSSKCTVTGGIVKGGTKVGDSIIGAVIYGGIAECGLTIDGCTTLGESGYIKPGHDTIPSDLINTITEHKSTDAYEKNIDDLVIWWKHTGSWAFDTNISTIKI